MFSILKPYYFYSIEMIKIEQWSMYSIEIEEIKYDEVEVFVARNHIRRYDHRIIYRGRRYRWSPFTRVWEKDIEMPPLNNWHFQRLNNQSAIKDYIKNHPLTSCIGV